MTVDDRHVLDKIPERIEEIRKAGGNGSVTLHMQGGKVRAVKTEKTETIKGEEQ